MSNVEQAEEIQSPLDVPTLRRGTFYIGAYNPELFEGWTNGELWNGWATPAFEYEEASRMMDVHNKMESFDPEDKPQAWYDSEKDRFCFITVGNGREIETYPSFRDETGGQTRKLYGIGSWYWTWEEYTTRA